MESVDRILGQLEEFKDWATMEFANLRHGQSLIIERIEKIDEARFVLYGKITVINCLVLAFIETIAHNLFK